MMKIYSNKLYHKNFKFAYQQFFSKLLRSDKRVMGTYVSVPHNFSSDLNKICNIYCYSTFRRNIIRKNIYFPRFLANKFCNDASTSSLDQGIPYDPDRVKEVLSHEPISPPNSKLIKVAIIGVPNSGKSTLINSLMEWKVIEISTICSVSEKVHTTQCSARAIYSKGEIQVVYVDTPGLLSPEEIKKYRPKPSLVIDPELSLQHADLIAVVHDIANRFTRNALPTSILRLLALHPNLPSILILNKVDVLRRYRRTLLLPLTETLTEGMVGNAPIIPSVVEREGTPFSHERDKLRLLQASEQVEVSEESLSRDCSHKEESLNHEHNFEKLMRGNVQLTEQQVEQIISKKKGWSGFSEVFMVSALKGVGMNNLRDYFLSKAKEGKWIFSNDVVTDQTPQDMALLTLRSKFLGRLPKNVPYELRYRLLHWELTDSDMLKILIGVYCPFKNMAELVIGPSGRVIRSVVVEAEQELRDIFRTEVSLKVSVDHDPKLKALRK